jgi:acetylornithine/succinyldiaminopimelate/putrescine aminotransferase
MTDVQTAKPAAASKSTPVPPQPSPRTQQLIDRAKQVLIPNYARVPSLVMDHGKGALLWDTDGREYIDLFAGFGGCVLGHCHPALIEAATKQAGRLWHVGNTYHTEPQIELAERLNKFAFRGEAFFCHSGAEANEAAVKLARLRGQDKSPRRWKVISLHKSFHGRTLAMIAATGNPNVRAGFAPDVPGFTQVDPATSTPSPPRSTTRRRRSSSSRSRARAGSISIRRTTRGECGSSATRRASR